MVNNVIKTRIMGAVGFGVLAGAIIYSSFVAESDNRPVSAISFDADFEAGEDLTPYLTLPEHLLPRMVLANRVESAVPIEANVVGGLQNDQQPDEEQLAELVEEAENALLLARAPAAQLPRPFLAALGSGIAGTEPFTGSHRPSSSLKRSGSAAGGGAASGSAAEATESEDTEELASEPETSGSPEAEPGVDVASTETTEQTENSPAAEDSEPATSEPEPSLTGEPSPPGQDGASPPAEGDIPAVSENNNGNGNDAGNEPTLLAGSPEPQSESKPKPEFQAKPESAEPKPESDSGIPLDALPLVNLDSLGKEFTQLADNGAPSSDSGQPKGLVAADQSLVVAVSEPSALVTLLLGFSGLVWLRRRRSI